MIHKLISRLDSGTLELLKHGKNYITVSMMTKGLSIISIPIMTRLLVPSDYGILAIFGTLVSILGIIFGFGIRGAVSRYYYEKTDDFGSFITTNTIFVWCAGIIISIVLFFNISIIAEVMNIPNILVVFAILLSFISASYSLTSAYLEASKQSLLLSRISIVQVVLILIFTIIVTLMLKEDRYLGSVYVQTIFSFFFFLFSLYMLKKIGELNVQIKHLQYSLVFGLPIVLHLSSGFIMNSADQIMINKMLGSHETGLYTFAYKVAMLFQMLSMGLNQAWLPIFYEKLREDKYEEIDVIVKKLAYIVFGGALLIVLFAPLLIIILAPKSYAVALSLVPIIVGGFMFEFFYNTYAKYAFYAKKTSMFVLVTIVTGLVNIGLNYLFIPKFGYTAAAWTTLITYALFFLLHYMNVIYNIKFFRVVPLKIVLFPGIFSASLIMISILANTYVKSPMGLYAIYFCLIAIYLVPIFIKKRKKSKAKEVNEIS